ncbi:MULTISPECIES: thermonuclease family protein [unclassified Prochlorococcus]|uniref:thermonuclease family protein n=1 Tax=unclassified Prochlorococcus TaxID=2627481 RepID=UPI000533A18C|nr:MULTISPECIES: thermonuclease family protein [unclassified Prochlorococcus]KGG23264.1 nuclease [Prochlorococcus sp. MIT 0701]KGG25614.1 nuclease [Prochlorococcus sp. MIT 0702]KGG30441.1 nuclease [Prochlorococcus sp. MIT 0703]
MSKAFLVLLLALWPVASNAAEVLSIGDGDTLTVIEGNRRIKVRLACIDAPETSQSPYGTTARQALKSLLPVGTDVSLRVKATDRYGRTVAEVIRTGSNINQSLVSSGNTFVYWQYIGGCDRQTYSRLENKARSTGFGIWSVPGGIQRPWDYRQSRQSNSNGKRYRCKDISSWNAAQELLRQGHTYLDRDKDGEACESLK